MPRVARLGWLVLAGIAFGVLVAVLKGQDSGVRDALGNTSAPWVLLPFLAGARFRRPAVAAAAGVAVTLAAFLGFYGAEAVILDLGPHPWYVDLRLTLGSGHVYELWGLASGAVYGALGGLWAARASVAAPVAVALAFVAEPLVVLALWQAGIWGGGDLLMRYPALWAAEVVVGLVGIVVALRVSAPARARRRARPPGPRASAS